MATLSQAGRPFTIDTPLGQDALLVESLTGSEALSELYAFDVGLIAIAVVSFDKLLGAAAAIQFALPGSPPRWLHGILNHLVEEGADNLAGTDIFRYRARLVPRFWLWTQRVQSRIFLDRSVPEILATVLEGLSVKFHLSKDYAKRNHCTQYGESDFDFASRLMEEEGIYYHFEHSAQDEELVIVDGIQPAVDLPGQASIAYDRVAGGTRDHGRIFAWHKSQEIRPSRHTLWDHCFEFPQNHLEASHGTGDTVEVGTVSHHLTYGANQELEIFEYPGDYARRFDGIDKAGAVQATRLQGIFDDNVRAARLRNEEENAQALVIGGQSSCSHFLPGFRFQLERHYNGNGKYLLTRVTHRADLKGLLGSEGPAAVVYENDFTCLPAALPFRPRRRTPRPSIPGGQTATVVGLAKGDIDKEAIFCDKYGRVKVQYHWDRHGQYDAGSSSWLRVAQCWAGKGFGATHIPRSGHEVIVAFQDGDPDRPIIVGTVYNAEKMPALSLPEHAAHSGFRSRSVQKGSGNFHEIRFDDTPGAEEFTLHSEKHLHQEAETSMTHLVGWGGGGSGSGSGEGGAKAPFAWFQAIKGQNFESKYGLSGDLVLGPYFEVVIGSNVDLAAPLRADITLGVSGELVVGTQIETIVGPKFGYQKGPSIEITHGNVYEFTKGNVLDKIEGNAYEVVKDGDLTFAVNGWVVEMFSKETLTPVVPDDLNFAGTCISVLQSFNLTPAAALTHASGDEFEDWMVANSLEGITTFAAKNPIVLKEAFKEFFTLLYDDACIVSKNGDIHLTALGAGKKIILQADTIELRGNSITNYTTAAAAGDQNGQLPLAVFTDTVPMTQKALEIETTFIEEAMHIMELDAEGALGFTLSTTAWKILLGVLIALMLLTVGIAAATTATAKSD